MSEKGIERNPDGPIALLSLIILLAFLAIGGYAIGIAHDWYFSQGAPEFCEAHGLEYSGVSIGGGKASCVEKMGNNIEYHMITYFDGQWYFYEK